MLVEELFAECDDIIDQILEHDIVKSLAGNGNLDKDTLIAVSKQFYIQDYYFLVYGYGSAKSYRIDTTSNRDTLKNLGDHRNPFTSSSVSRLLDIMENRGISKKGGANAATQSYIVFELEKAFSSVTELFLCRLACGAVFQSIGVTLNLSTYQRDMSQLDERLAEFIAVYTDTVETDYLTTLIEICSELLKDLDEEEEQQMKTTFKEGCEKELDFLNSLLPENEKR